MCQTRRLPQSIMEIYGQGRQRSMTQFWPEDFKDFYQILVLGDFFDCASAARRFLLDTFCAAWYSVQAPAGVVEW